MPTASTKSPKVHRVIWGPQRFYLSLGWKTLIAFGLVVFVPMAALLLTTSETMRHSLEDEIYNSLEANLKVLMTHAQRPLDDVRIALAQTAQDDSTATALVTQDAAALLHRLRQLEQRFPFVDVWLAIDSAQVVRGRLNGSLGEHPELGRLLQRSLATQEETLVSFDLLPRKVYLDEDPARFDGLPPQVLTQAVAAPVRGAGVLIGLFALERAGWLAERLQGLLTLDNTFVALLQGDRLLATVPIAQNLWAADRPIGNHLERAIRAGQLFKGRLPFGEDGGLVVSEPLFNTDFQPVAALALAVDSARISQYVREHSRNIYLAMALGIGLSMLIAYLAYRDTITPLQAIVNAQHDFAAGNYGVRTEIETKDEFERLGAGFNRMADAVEAHDRRLEQYNALSSLVNLSISPEALLQGTLDRVIEISRSQLGAIYLLDEGSNRLAPLVAHGLDLEKIGTIKLGEGLPGQAALEKVVKRVTEVPESGALDYKVGIASLPPQELVYFPLIYRGELIGLLLLGSLSHFPEDEFVLLEHLSRQAAIILNDTVAQKRIRDLGVRDSLTGVNNRTHFTARLEQAWGEATRYGSQLAVLMVDIDHFRQIAERYGYHLADNVLIAVARSLRKSVRKSDLVARFGENRFSVLLPHSDTEQAVATAEKVRKNIIGTTVPQLERERITISIGVASYPEIPVQSPIELVRKANAALTDAKSGGRNRVVNA